MTIIQQTPIKDDGKAVEIGLGSIYAKQLGLAEVSEYDGTTTSANPSELSENTDQSKQGEISGKKKKKNNKKKKKK